MITKLAERIWYIIITHAQIQLYQSHNYRDVTHMSCNHGKDTNTSCKQVICMDV